MGAGCPAGAASAGLEGFISLLRAGGRREVGKNWGRTFADAAAGAIVLVVGVRVGATTAAHLRGGDDGLPGSGIVIGFAGSFTLGKGFSGPRFLADTDFAAFAGAGVSGLIFADKNLVP